MNGDPESSLPPGVTLPMRLRSGGRIRHTAWSPRGDCLAAALEDGGVRVWTGMPDPLEKTVPASREFQAFDTPLSQIAWSPDGRCIAAASAAGRRIAGWDAETLERRGTIDVGEGKLLCFAWAGDDRIVAAAATGTAPHQRLAIRGYGAASGEPAGEWLDEARDDVFVAVSADGRLLAIAAEGSAIQVWDLARTRVVATAQSRGWAICGVALTPDSRALVLSFENGELRVYGQPGGQQREVLYEHSQAVYSVACSDDGRLLASRSADDSIRLWRCDTWGCVATLQEASYHPAELSFRPGTHTLTSFESNDTALRLWELDYDEIIRGTPMIDILMLTANPFNDTRLRLDKEEREIKEQLQLAGLRSRFNFHSRAAVRPRDFSLGLLELRPRIVHFSGHGGDDGSIWLEDDSGRSRPIAPAQLAALLKRMSEYVECVVLNACHTEKQAEAIARSIDFAIGTRGEIDDEAAIAFSVGFYQALGAGCSIEEAFELGCAQAGMHSELEANQPVIKRKRRSRRKGTPASPAPSGS